MAVLLLPCPIETLSYPTLLVNGHDIPRRTPSPNTALYYNGGIGEGGVYISIRNLY
jgi:hypothetical protein